MALMNAPKRPSIAISSTSSRCTRASSLSAATAGQARTRLRQATWLQSTSMSSDQVRRSPKPA